MGKPIFLSFRPEFFRPILYDIKKYEYRKRFCDEPTTAFLYLSAPVQEVIGIMELGKPLKIEECILNYEEDDKVYIRLKERIEDNDKFAIPIKSFQMFKEPVSIEKIKLLDKSFHIPQLYLNLNNYPITYGYLKEQETYEREFYNKHDRIYEENLGMSCLEMEGTKEFKDKDEKYIKNKKYDLIKSTYLLKKEG